LPPVIVTRRAVADLRGLRDGLGLPPTTFARVRRSLALLRLFPLAGVALSGRWEGSRFLIGPWPWMVIVYVRDVDDDAVYVVAIHDGRSSSAATGG
jgi:plasmid stabilization system protein ParE